MNSCDLSQVFRKQPFVAFYAPSISAIKIETHQFILILSASCFCWLKFSDSFLYFIFFWSYGPIFQNISLLSPLENFVTYIFIPKLNFRRVMGFLWSGIIKALVKTMLIMRYSLQTSKNLSDLRIREIFFTI